MSLKTRFDLEQADIPSAWYNLNADFSEPVPPALNPATQQPVPPEAWEAIFPRNLIDQELSREPWIEIPDEVRDMCTPCGGRRRCCARCGFEKALQHTGAHLLQV
jgi:tryptophan synthase beta chain